MYTVFKPPYTIVGVDFSLTSPGMFAIRVNENYRYSLLGQHNIKTKSNEPWYTRTERVQKAIIGFIKQYNPSMVMVENYSYGSTNGRELAGEVHGITLFKLFESGFPPENVYRIVSPSQLKKFITGKGNAKKPDVVKAVNEFFGTSFKNSENDMADALVLAYIGYCMNHYSLVEPTLNEKQVEVMQKILENKQSF